MACECDYSYICRECQTKIDIENRLDFERERMEWVVEAIKKLAEKLGVELDEEPKKRGY